MKIIGTDYLARESVADKLLIAWFPRSAIEHAKAACDALNKLTDDDGGTFYKIVEDDYRLSKGMEDLV